MVDTSGRVVILSDLLKIQHQVFMRPGNREETLQLPDASHQA